jgi:hypothetical protein
MTTREHAVYTRFDAPWIIPRVLPPSLRLEGARGVRIVIPSAAAMRIPLVRDWLATAERRLTDTRAAYFAGFYAAILRKCSAV